MRLLIVSLDYPDHAFYICPTMVGVYLLGRKTSRYMLLSVAEDWTSEQIVLPSSSDVHVIQKEVDVRFEILKLREQLKLLTAKLESQINAVPV